MKQPRKMTYAPLYFIDFKEGCEDLTNEQIGAYLRILFEIYETMGPIAFDERRLGRRLNSRPHKARAMVESLVQMGKLYLTREGQISNHRAENEIVKFVSISVQNQLNAKGRCTDPISVQSQFNRDSVELSSNSTLQKPNKISVSDERPLSERETILDKNNNNSSSFDVLALPLPQEALEEKALRSAAAVAAALKRRDLYKRKVRA